MPHVTTESRQQLFGSAPWLQAWTQAWGDLVAPAGAPEFASLSVYSTREKLKGIIPVQTAAPLGVSTAGMPSLRSEYFYFSREPAQSASAIQAFSTSAQAAIWDQLCIPDIPINSNELPLIKAAASNKGWELVDQGYSTAYSVNTRTGSFNDYLQTLGKNSRLQLFNRRKHLEKLGQVQLHNYWPDAAGFLQIINGFHQERWHKPIFSPRNWVFIEALLNNLAAAGHSIDLSVLTLDGKPIAAALDLHLEGRVYNLQSGFLKNFDSKISLGTLHFGYKIEAAFANPTLHCYDFMAGHGKKSDYKKAFATDSLQLVSLLFARTPWLKQLYRVRNAIYRSPLNSVQNKAAFLLSVQGLRDVANNCGAEYFC